MEPIRPRVDAFLLDWMRREPLQRKWFFEERDGNCRLTGEFAAQLSETSKLWKQALGPFAEWMLRALWSGSSSTSKIGTPATRLTQDRKREAKGIPTLPLADPAITERTPPLSTASEDTQVVPRTARLHRFDPVAQSRRAESQRRQAAAQRAWRPSENPKWLDEKFYRQHILGRLLTIQVSEIRSALSVSAPYALMIQTGRRIPHARHWLNLGRLAGVVTVAGAATNEIKVPGMFG